MLLDLRRRISSAAGRLALKWFRWRYQRTHLIRPAQNAPRAKRDLKIPLMPKGVEHVETKGGPEAIAGENTSDAERH